MLVEMIPHRGLWATRIVSAASGLAPLLADERRPHRTGDSLLQLGAQSEVAHAIKSRPLFLGQGGAFAGTARGPRRAGAGGAASGGTGRRCASGDGRGGGARRRRSLPPRVA